MDTVRQLKATRRRILRFLYEQYLKDPLASTDPYEFFDAHGFSRHDLVVNIHYLHDSGLVELLMGYTPPLFSGARITAKGIDLVENHYAFNLRFPALNGETQAVSDTLPALVEQLTQRVEQLALDGERRRTLLRDALYLREELARPHNRWRGDVIGAVLGWMEAALPEDDAACGFLLKQIHALVSSGQAADDAAQTAR